MNRRNALDRPEVTTASDYVWKIPDFTFDVRRLKSQGVTNGYELD